MYQIFVLSRPQFTSVLTFEKEALWKTAIATIHNARHKWLTENIDIILSISDDTGHSVSPLASGVESLFTTDTIRDLEINITLTLDKARAQSRAQQAAQSDPVLKLQGSGGLRLDS